jgi:hypothetical protein
MNKKKNFIAQKNQLDPFNMFFVFVDKKKKKKMSFSVNDNCKGDLCQVGKQKEDIASAAVVMANLGTNFPWVSSSIVNVDQAPRKEWVCIKSDNACMRVLKPVLPDLPHFATSKECADACFQK